MGSVALAIVAIVVTITIFFKNRKRKTLDYLIVDDVKILSDRAGDMRGDIVVTVGTLQLKDPRIVTVRYINTGNQEIVKDDFLNRSITTTDASGAVNSHLAGVSDESIISVESGLAPHKSYFADCLNPGDYLEVQYILDMSGVEGGQPFRPVCRIKGATRQPKRIDPRLTGKELAELSIEVARQTVVNGPFRAATLFWRR